MKKAGLLALLFTIHGSLYADIQRNDALLLNKENLATPTNGIISGADKVKGVQNLIDGKPSTMAEINHADKEQIDNFDGHTRYNGKINAWLQYEFNTPTVITAYALGMTTVTNSDCRPICWELKASNDEQHWVTLDIRHNAISKQVDFSEELYDLSRSKAITNYAKIADRMLSFCEKNLERPQDNDGLYWISKWAVDPTKRNEDWGGYWWAAHAIDNYLDHYDRTKKSRDLKKIAQLLSGAQAKNDNTLINHYYDDMEWMALALLRACDINANLNRQYMPKVKFLFNDIIGGWSDVEGGGIHWNKALNGDGKTKNACSNAPAMILAARLYQHTGEKEYLDWAKRIYQFMYDECRFPDGVVKDHTANDNHEVTFSYNQGTWVGGLLELYKITGEEHYRQTATSLMDFLLFGKWYSPRGIMSERLNYNQADGGLFKGIFIRYLTQWILSGKLDEERQFRYTEWLLEQARSASLTAVNETWYIINPSWTEQYHIDSDEHDTSRQQTGLMLMEAVEKLRRAGIINKNYGISSPYYGKPFRYYRLYITETKNSDNIMLGEFKLFGNS